MALIYEDTYWNHKGKHPEIVTALQKLIPAAGKVKNPDDNPFLDTYRKATNCYYDLYNNGLCNRRSEFFDIFGFDGRSDDDEGLTKEVVKKTESAMNKTILRAAKEQGIEVK